MIKDIDKSLFNSLKEFIEENKETIDSEDISPKINEFVNESIQQQVRFCKKR